MTTYIEQRYRNDCAVAAIAMALDVDYDYLHKLVLDADIYKPDGPGGISFHDMLPLITKLGLVESNPYKGIHGDVTIKHKSFHISPEYFTSTLWGRPSVLSVPSLNQAGKRHAIFYDGDKLYDPSPRTKYQTFINELGVSEAIVFSHNYRAKVAQVLLQ